ncbi:MAG: S26 family signal peptidase [Oscillospiraceae bacterium]|nr:S26 family signal peptidase [Oscillospiraceae bacterium]
MNGQKSNWILNILLVLLVLALGLGIVPAFLGAVNPNFQNTWYGFRPYIVVSDSMEPTIMTGALVIGRAVPFADLEYRDIITFDMNNGNGQPVLNTHRIVERRTYEVITQGDREDITMPDAAPVTQYNFRYRVVWFSNTIRLGSTTGILLFIVLPAVVLVLLVAGALALLAIIRRKRSNIVPLTLPEYPTDEEQQLQPPLDDERPKKKRRAKPSPMLMQPQEVENTDVEDDELCDLIEDSLRPPAPPPMVVADDDSDDDDNLLAMLNHVLATHNNKEEHEWFDKLMRQKGIALPH